MNDKKSIRETPEFRNAVSRILGLPGGLDLLLKNPELMETVPLRDLFSHISEEDIERVLDSPAGDYVVGERREALIALLTERKDEIDERLEALRNAASHRGKDSDDAQVP
jgi:hypothetical protein